MLPVMNLHRLRVDVRFERGEIVRELGQFVRHSSSSIKRGRESFVEDSAHKENARIEQMTPDPLL